MNGRELKKQIRKVKYIFGWVNFTSEDGHYTRLVKQDVLFIIEDNTEYQAVIRDNEPDAIYIN